MIKVPATPQGIPAVQALISEGINVNVTQLFSQDRYEDVAKAYLAGLEHYANRASDPGRVASVASSFLSRIDTAIESLVTARLDERPHANEAGVLRSLMGQVAIANAKLAYQRYQELFSGPRWQALADRGAQTQRLLWASTGTKTPTYRDVVYVEELIGRDTVTTLPPATFEAAQTVEPLGDKLAGSDGHRPCTQVDLDAGKDVLALKNLCKLRSAGALLADGFVVHNRATDEFCGPG